MKTTEPTYHFALHLVDVPGGAVVSLAITLLPKGADMTEAGAVQVPPMLVTQATRDEIGALVERITALVCECGPLA